MVSFFICSWDSNNQMQQSGGLLLAADLDGGNTLIFVPSGNENANESHHPPHKKEGYRLVSFFYMFMGLEQSNATVRRTVACRTFYKHFSFRHCEYYNNTL